MMAITPMPASRAVSCFSDSHGSVSFSRSGSTVIRAMCKKPPAVNGIIHDVRASGTSEHNELTKTAPIAGALCCSQHTHGGCDAAAADRHHSAQHAGAGGQQLQLGRVPAIEARLEQNGKVADLVRNFVHCTRDNRLRSAHTHTRAFKWALTQNGKRAQHSVAEGHQKRAGHRQAVREIVNRIGQQIQITSHLDRCRLLTFVRQETAVRYVLDVACAAATAATVLLLAAGAAAVVRGGGQLTVVAASHQTVGDVDAARLWLTAVRIHELGEDLLDNGEDENAGQHPEAAAHRVRPIGGVAAPRLRQQMQEHIAQEAADGEAEQDFQRFGFGGCVRECVCVWKWQTIFTDSGTGNNNKRLSLCNNVFEVPACSPHYLGAAAASTPEFTMLIATRSEGEKDHSSVVDLRSARPAERALVDDDHNRPSSYS